MPRPALVWFTRDLRLHDQPALHDAIATGRPVLACFVLDEKAGGDWAPGGASRWWLHHALAALTRSLKSIGLALVLRRGDTLTELMRLAREVGAASLHAGYQIEPAGRAVIEAIGPRLAELDCTFCPCWTTLLVEPEALRTKGGTTFFVYTPFSKAVASAVTLDLLPAPGHAEGAPAPRGDDLDQWRLLPRKPDWAGGLRETWTPGEVAGLDLLRRFVAGRVADYADTRNLPGTEGVSRLSPYLHWGEVSVRRAWVEAAARPGKGSQTFINELIWREFSAHLLWHHPTMPDAPLRPAFAAMRWRRDEAGLLAWRRGRTGIPIVDAGMRQLWHSGWQHNRVRMIAASFLIKHLLIDWREGEAWFWDTLVDADLASNAGNWQWVAGSGADAAPFFRIFNPELQGRKFDPDGDYVRRWVPELAAVPAAYIHAPWEAPALELRAAGVTLGRTYPEPIVDLGAARLRALEAFKHVSGKPAR
jgi:deoxyribodipyrimidine photo-lyase